jgi:hypothetical protein
VPRGRQVAYYLGVIVAVMTQQPQHQKHSLSRAGCSQPGSMSALPLYTRTACNRLMQLAMGSKCRCVLVSWPHMQCQLEVLALGIAHAVLGWVQVTVPVGSTVDWVFLSHTGGPAPSPEDDRVKALTVGEIQQVPDKLSCQSYQHGRKWVDQICRVLGLCTSHAEEMFINRVNNIHFTHGQHRVCLLPSDTMPGPSHCISQTT